MGEKYRDMSDSLNKGEEEYNLDDAKYLRVKILKIAENVDIISREISNLDASIPDDNCETSGPPSPLLFQLQQRIRVAAVNFVKEGLVGLPALPSEDKYEALKAFRRENAVKRIEEEKRAARQAKLKFEQDLASKRSNRAAHQPQSPASDQKGSLKWIT